MGKAQSKRSVDITTDPAKDSVVTEGTGKLEKIEDVDQLKSQANGDAQHNEGESNSLPANDGQQYPIPSLLTQRIRSCMDRLDGSIESSQVMITTLLQQLNHLAVESSPSRPAEDGEATSVQFVRIQTADDRGMLIWTSNGYYISLSFILFLHLMILFVFGLISLCFSKPSAASAQPKVNV